MAKLKGYKKLNKDISKVFKEFEISGIKGGDDYAYYFDSDKCAYDKNQTTGKNQSRE